MVALPIGNPDGDSGFWGMVLGSFLFALGFAGVHLATSRLPTTGVVPRSVWLSLAGGVSVAYVFLHLLPGLVARGAKVGLELGLAENVSATVVFMVALLGLTGFYGLENLVAKRRRAPGRVGGEVVDLQVFSIHLGSFAAYNVLIGYLLVQRETEGWRELVTFGIAMAAHFLSADVGLHQDHAARYDRFARWLLAGAVLAGWALGQLVEVSGLAIGLLYALLAGGVILNVMKEELPEDRQSRFWAFLLGVCGYSGILVLA